jgi:hypothetical protein
MFTFATATPAGAFGGRGRVVVGDDRRATCDGVDGRVHAHHELADRPLNDRRCGALGGGRSDLHPQRTEHDHQQRHADRDQCHHDEVGTPAVQHLAADQPHHDQREDRQRHLRLTEQHADDDVAERPGHQEQVEEDEEQQDGAGAGVDQPMGDRAQAVSVVADGHHDCAVVAHPADERHPEHQPDDGRQPPPQVRGRDRPDDRPGRGDRLEVVAVQDAPARRHEVHPVHVHPRRSGLARIRLDDVAVDAPSVE